MVSATSTPGTAETTVDAWTRALAEPAADGVGPVAAVIAAVGAALIARAATGESATAPAGLRRELRGTAQEGEMLRRHALAAADREYRTAAAAPAAADPAGAAVAAAQADLGVLDLAALAVPALRLLRNDARPSASAEVAAAAAAYATSVRLGLCSLRAHRDLAHDHGADPDELTRLGSALTRFEALSAILEELATAED